MIWVCLTENSVLALSVSTELRFRKEMRPTGFKEENQVYYRVQSSEQKEEIEY